MPTVEQLEKLLSLDPADTFVLYGLGQAHAKAGRHGEAIGFYDRCLAEDPHYCYAYYFKAQSLEAMGELTEAVATLEAGREASRAAGEDKAWRETSEYLATVRETLSRAGGG